MTCADNVSDVTLTAANALESIGAYARERFATLPDAESFVKGFFDTANAGDQDALDAIGAHFSSYNPTENAYEAGDAHTGLAAAGAASYAFGRNYLRNYSELARTSADAIESLKAANPGMTSRSALNTLNKIGAQAEAAAKASFALAIGMAAAEIYQSQNPDYAGIRAGAEIGAGMLSASIFNSVGVAVAVGLGAAPVAAAATGATFAAIAAAAAVYAWQKHGEDITNAIFEAKENSVEMVQASIDVFGEFDDAITEVFDATTGVAEFAVDELLNVAEEAMEGISTCGEGLPQFIEDIADKFLTAILASSPIVIDVDDDGIELIALDDSLTRFDLTEDGFAERTGWVATDDALLAIDLNDNGQIDNSSELFGSMTTDGFTELALYDSNQDGVIDNQDAVWDDLILWRDLDKSGSASDGELFTMGDYSIISINLGATEVAYQIAGHDVTHESTVTFANMSTAEIVDVWFDYDSIDTVYVADYTPDTAILELPTLRGYGTLPALHIAMSLDNNGTGNLLGLVSDVAGLSLADLFDETGDLYNAVKDIVYRWAGVEDVPPTSRGLDIDGRDLALLEAMMGQNFVQVNASDITYPGPHASTYLNAAASIAFNNIYARIAAQSAGGELFEGDWHYDIVMDEFIGITGLDTGVLDDLETEATGLANSGEREIFWANVVRMIEYTVGTANLDGGDLTALEDAIFDSDNSLDLQADILDNLVYEEPIGGTQTGTSGGETLNGGADNDTLNGLAGNDTLNGGGGNDTLDGGNDNDSLYGDAGQDYLKGGSGEDKYYHDLGDGWDTVRESGTGGGNTNDRIMLGAGIDSGDVTITRYSNTGLLIHIDTGAQTGNIFLENQFNYSAGGGHTEWIEYNDTSTVDLDAMSFTLTGTASNDTLYGAHANMSSGADTIYGGAGHDTINGYAPGETDSQANTLYGEDGNDTINGGTGVDTIYGGNGNDTIDGNAGNDDITGGAGNDTAIGDGGNDTFRYTSGIDVYADNSGTDELRLDAAWNGVTPQYFRIGNDMQIYFDANDNITITNFFSGAGNKIETMIYANSTSVDLTTQATVSQGTSGNDSLSGTSGADTFYGFGGNDTLNGAGGSAGNDTLYGGTGNDTLNGGNDNDYLDGGAGDDTMSGGAGNDHYVYASGTDLINEVTGTEILELVSGWTWGDVVLERRSADVNDLIVSLGGSNVITLNGMFTSTTQIETLRLNDGTGDVNLFNLSYTSYGDGSGNSISGISNSNFSGGNPVDTIYGLGGNDTLDGLGGNDIVYGGDGNDTLEGGNDNDTLYGENGDDTLKGEGGNDTLVFSAGLDSFEDIHGGTDTVWIAGGTTVNDISFSNSGSVDTKITINASVDEITVKNLRSGNSTLHIENIQFDDGFTANLPSYGSWLNGTSGADSSTGNGSANVMIGFAGNDTMDGLGGNDNIHGGSGNDSIEGGDGTDLLHGGVGDDTLYGENGLDTLFGGAGADTFRFDNNAFNNVDAIRDFSTAQGDKLHIADILSGYDDGVDDITQWVEITTSGSDSILKVDADGGANNFVQIATLYGITGLTDEAALETNGYLIAA